MIKLLGSLAFVVAMSFMGLPSAIASDETPTVQKGDEKDGKRRHHKHHRKHHRKHHHKRHHKHADENKDDKK